MFIFMNVKSPLEDPDHWRARAEMTRSKAEQARGDVHLKRKLLRVAEEYDRLAQRAELWRTGDKT